MSSRNRIFSITVIAFALLAICVAIYLFFRQPANPPRSLLLYTNYQSPEMITNWIVDTDTDKKWEVGKGLAAGGWSPSGKHLAFHTLSPSPIEIWVSDNTGNNMRQVFDSKKYPNLKITGYDWFTDEIILVNVTDKAQNSGFVYMLNINSLSFEQHNRGNFTSLSLAGKWWIQWTEQHYELADLSGKTLLLSSDLSEYYLTPNGNQVAYPCSGESKYSSLCVAEISINGITNEIKFVNMRTYLYAFGEMKWSPDGKNFGFLCSPNKTEIRFCAISGEDGAIVYNWKYPSKTTRFIWSPRDDKVIDWDGLLLDLKTGQINNFFADINETVPSYIVDWRMIEVP